MSGCESLAKVYFNADDAGSRVFYNCPSLELYVIGLLDMKKVEHSWLDGVSKVYVSTYAVPGEGFLETFTPTDEKEGNYVLYVYCEHTWSKGEDPENPCRTFDSCTKCGAEKETDAVHTPGQWETVTQPTEYTVGKRHLKCTLCGEVLEIEEIPRLEEATSEEVSEESTEEVSEEVSEEESEEASEEESSVPSADPVPEVSEESIPGEEPTQGVSLWVVLLVGVLCAGVAAGITWLICKKK